MSTATTAAVIAVSASVMQSNKKNACKPVLASFDSSNASVQEMQAYADCVNTVYPKQMFGGDVLVFQVAFIFGVIGAIVGVCWSIKEYGLRDVFPHVFTLLVSAIIGSCSTLIIYGVWKWFVILFL